jgi:hypothetical protein
MGIRDFLRLLLKLFGLYLLISTVFSIPAYIVYMVQTGTDLVPILFNIAGEVFVIAALACIFFYLVFNPDKIIDRLKLDRGFEATHIHFEKLSSGLVLKIGISIVGLLLFVRNISDLLTYGYRIFKKSVTASEDYFGGGAEEQVSAVIALLNIIVAFILITNMNGLTKFLLQTKEEESTQE